MRVGFWRPDESANAKTRCLSLFAIAYGVEFFYFTPERVDVERRTIRGLFFNKESGNFIEKETPYPDIIDEHPILHHKYPELFDSLSQTGIFVYSYALGGKMMVNSVLEKGGYTKYLIDTFEYSDMDVDVLLDMYGCIIIKPNKGNQGRNIYKLRRDGDSYLLHYGLDVEELTRQGFDEKYGKKFYNYFIAQEFIDSTTGCGNPFDIRVFTCRGKGGKWSAVKMFARIGSARGITSNIHQGGSMGFIDLFLNSEFGDKRKAIYSELVAISRNLPDILQAGYDDLLFELGIDVAINRSKGDELKLLEVNTGSFPAIYDFEPLEARFHYYSHLYDLHKK